LAVKFLVVAILIKGHVLMLCMSYCDQYVQQQLSILYFLLTTC